MTRPEDGQPDDEPVRYHLDAHDRLIWVNPAWDRFASANQAGEALLGRAVLGRSLWEFITGPATEHLYRLLFARVRSTGEPVAFPFRCDAPATRRTLRMQIELLPAAGLRFTIQSLAETPRDAVPLLDPTVPRSGALITMCSWCKRIAGSGGTWLEIEQAAETLQLFESSAPPAVTHSVCGACEQQLNAVLG